MSNQRKPVIAPSILSADFAFLADAIEKVKPVTNRIHIDCMDGHFVPNLTLGPPIVKSLRKHTDAYFDCHLMCTDPGILIDPFVQAGANAITVHVEVENVDQLLKKIRASGIQVGITFNPDTPFSAVQPYLDQVDILLFMSVFPGFGGQKFISEVLEKVVQADQFRNDNELDIIFTIDGGINKETIADAAKVGCDVFVAGSAVFGTEDPALAAKELEELAMKALSEN